MIRISSGSLKGRTISSAPKLRSKPLRPTQSLVKKAIFSILKQRLAGCYFLDLFAGSGAVGMEAFSNGAKKIYFVEKNPRLAKDISANLRELSVEGSVFRADYHQGLIYFRRKAILFNLIFADPPYEWLEVKNHYQQFLTRILESGILHPNGMFILERTRKIDQLQAELFSTSLSKKVEVKNKTYGTTALDFYQLKPS